MGEIRLIERQFDVYTACERKREFATLTRFCNRALVTVFVLSFIGYALYVAVVAAERGLIGWHESAAGLGP